MNNKISQLLQELTSLASVPSNHIACPHCGREITLTVTKKRGRKPGSSINQKKRGPRRGAKRNAELPNLAIAYAQKKFNGRIGDSYRAVKEAIGTTRGKSKEQIRDLKMQWYKKQLAS